jgi:hypothetical protein
MTTTSFMVQMNYTKEEISAQLMLDKEKAQRALEHVSARYIQCWFRERKRGKVADGSRRTIFDWDAHRKHQLHLLKQLFRSTVKTAGAQAAHLLADDVKIEQLADRSKELVEAVEVVKRRTDPEYMHPSDSDEEDLNEFEQAAKWQAKQYVKRKESTKTLGDPLKHRGTLKGKMALILMQKKSLMHAGLNMQQGQRSAPNMVLMLQEAAHLGNLLSLHAWCEVVESFIGRTEHWFRVLTREKFQG